MTKKQPENRELAGETASQPKRISSADKRCLVCGNEKDSGETITIVMSPGDTLETLCVPCAHPGE